ncbi:MAG: tetratricopeptide repeat protein [Spirochaetes bacterium]|nr:tetratricopeptide repeat protein [Spirochaetota bacterium]
MISSSVPREIVTMYNNALELSNHGNLDAALREYRRAIDAYPDFVAAYNNIGEIYTRMGDSEKAILSYLEALKIEKHYRVLLNLGVEHYNRKNYDQALKYFMESIKQEPYFLEGNYYAGLVHYTRNEYKKAEEYLQAVIAMDRRHLKANFLLAHIYYERKQYRKTIECLDRVWDLAEDKSFINRFYGFCHFYLGSYDKAVSYLTEALECRPEYARFKKYLDKLTFENKMKEIGDIETAITELEDDLARRDAQVLDLTKLSMLYIFKGEYKKAEKLIQSHKKKLA